MGSTSSSLTEATLTKAWIMARAQGRAYSAHGQLAQEFRRLRLEFADRPIDDVLEQAPLFTVLDRELEATATRAQPSRPRARCSARD
jgi:hypothetical protein